MRGLVRRTAPVLVWIAGLGLSLFTLRRWIFMLVAAFARPDDEPPRPTRLPDMLVLIPCHNEESTLPELFSHLSSLRYPANHHQIVFIDDAATDNTAALVTFYAKKNPVSIISQPQRRGKAAALNKALRQIKYGDLIAVLDADERPHPDTLIHLATALHQSNVGAAGGQRRVRNARQSPFATYAAFESLVHQYITARAKDRLCLGPPLLGSNCVYRRAAVEQIGGFRNGALLEDSDLTLRLLAAGWQTRFVAAAHSKHDAPHTWSGYWQQHLRWNHGFHQAPSPPKLISTASPWLLHLEQHMFRLGYLDRLFTLTGLVLLRWYGALGWVVGVSLLTPLLQVMLALHLSDRDQSLWRRLPWLIIIYPIDMAVALVGLIQTARGKVPVWETRSARNSTTKPCFFR